jgi:hypothetical protein
MRSRHKLISCIVLACFLMAHDFSGVLHSTIHLAFGYGHAHDSSELGLPKASQPKVVDQSNASSTTCPIEKLIKYSSSESYKSADNQFFETSVSKNLDLPQTNSIIAFCERFSHESRGPPQVV